jgi:hypothetical protein
LRRFCSELSKTYPSFASFLLGTVEQLLGVWGLRRISGYDTLCSECNKALVDFGRLA